MESISCDAVNRKLLLWIFTRERDDARAMSGAASSSASTQGVGFNETEKARESFESYLENASHNGNFVPPVTGRRITMR